MNDERIIELFFERSEQAIKELDDKYGRVCHSVSYNILNNRADAEECVNDAYWGTWNAIPPAKPNPLCAFVCKIVRNISLKRYEYNTAAKRNSVYDVAMEELENCLASAKTVEEEIAERELTKIIESFLNSLSYEFYYRFDGVPENTDDWYSLLASKYDDNGDVLLHCMFDAASRQNPDQDWKVDSVFTPEATQTKIINGVEVDIAQTKNSLKYKYWHYAIFTYDGVMYDVRVQSDNPEYVYEVLNTLLNTDR